VLPTVAHVSELSDCKWSVCKEGKGLPHGARNEEIYTNTYVCTCTYMYIHAYVLAFVRTY